MFLLTVVLAAQSLLLTPPKSNTANVLYCEVEEKTLSDGKTEVKSRRYWSNGATLFRSEKDGSGFTIINILNGNDGWMIETGGKSGYHFRKPSPQYTMLESERQDIFDSAREWLRRGGKKVGTQFLSGVAYDVYRRLERTKVGEATSTLFVSSRNSRPWQIQVAGTFLLGQKKVTFKATMQFKKWQTNKPTDITVFRPSAGYRIREVK